MTALIIDTLSIQPYIFGSNKLKENIGGSYIIEHLVYGKMIPLALEDSKISSNINLNEWSNAPATYKLKTDPSARVEIGYLGGGNAFLIFRAESDAKSFIRVYSKLLLEYFPGLKTAFGMFEFDYELGENYKIFRQNLNESLVKNRNLCATQTLPFKHGIVEDCAWTNEAQEAFVKFSNEEGDIILSKMAISRLKAVDDAQAALTKKFHEQIGDLFVFSNDTENFGQPDDKGYIAIVHADGNGMGIRFTECQSLEETRILSMNVAKYADAVMKKMMGYLIENKELLHSADWKKAKDSPNNTDQWILPIRPLIIGGDDITFVCEGRIGVHLAEKLLEIMTTEKVGEETISACAGVAVVHTKSPFYKAYQLTDELTQKAKDASRKENDSRLHFMICTGGFSGSYDSILKDQYTLPDGKVLKGAPYDLDGNAFYDLKKGMKQITRPISKGGWPRNKLMELRDALKSDRAAAKYFLKEIAARGLKLPEGFDKLWDDNNQTLLYDMIELLDFYPNELI